MELGSPPEVPARYRAFISYSHADARFAGWLHRKLEAWRLADKSRLAPVFIDRAELAAGSDLSEQVREALSESAALIVVSSPNAKASRWVGQEIDLFRTLHPDRPVLAALIDGEPEAAFPESLVQVGGKQVEPLAADFRTGHDGKRLGLIKIIAGLTRQPLDRLVQRDAQNRQRRVMAVTAGAVLLSLILSAALVFALRARAEAERQRSEAEGLVEFMLTDLRDKLKGVGRLDVMDAVNQRSMAHYQEQQGLGSLPDDIILRRVKLLQSMGEDDLQSTSNRERGKHSIFLAWQTSKLALDKNPRNTDFIWSHSQSEYWMGYVRYIETSPTGKLDKIGVENYWVRYRDLTANLANQIPANLAWRKEAGYADSNLCALHASPPANPTRALPFCVSAVRRLTEISTANAADLDLRLNLISTYGWKADAEEQLGLRNEALLTRSLQRAEARSAASDFPSDIRTAEALLTSNLGGATLFMRTGNTAEARQLLLEAKNIADKLCKHDPSNRDWQDWRKRVNSDIKKLYK